jgi:undecaprenyl-diphosphatase
MTWLQALFLAIIESLSEFLPISSTAQLLLFDQFFPAANRDLFATFAIFIQLGALLAVLSLFLRQLWRHRQLWPRLLLAILPTLIIGAFAYQIVKNYLQDASAITGWALIIGGIVFTWLDWRWRCCPTSSSNPQVDTPAYLSAVATAPKWKLNAVGVAQAVAIIPGVSRSGATIFGARALGFTKLAATELSFVLALPTIAAATGLDLLQEFLRRDVQVVCDCVLPSSDCFCPLPYSIFNHPSDWGLMILGLIIAFITARLTCHFFLKLLATRPFWYWGLYRVIAGLIWLAVI